MMRLGAVFYECGFALLVSGCAFPAAGPPGSIMPMVVEQPIEGPRGLGGHITVDQPVDQSAARFDSLVLHLVDARNDSKHIIACPCRVIHLSKLGIELEGWLDGTLDSARVLFFVNDGELWAVAQVDGEEFLTKVN